jgi:hypothetical protein
MTDPQIRPQTPNLIFPAVSGFIDHTSFLKETVRVNVCFLSEMTEK